MPKSSSSSHLKQCLGSGFYELGESSFSQSSNTCKLSPEDPYLVGCWSWLTDEKKKGRILPVRHQGNTNACYAFVIATTIGGAQGLEGCQCSEQELLDRLHMDFPPWPSCGVPYKVPDEGLPNNFVNGFGYAKKHGIYFVKDYQWVGRYQPEQPKNLPLNLEKIYVKDFKCVDDGNHKLIVEQLEKQPLAGFIKPTSTFLSWGFENLLEFAVLGKGDDSGASQFKLLNNNGFPIPHQLNRSNSSTTMVSSYISFVNYDYNGRSPPPSQTLTSNSLTALPSCLKMILWPSAADGIVSDR